MVVLRHPKYHPERKIQVPSVDLTGCASLRFPSLSLPCTFVSVCYFCLLRGFCVELHVLLVPFLQVWIPQSKVICLVKDEVYTYDEWMMRLGKIKASIGLQKLDKRHG